MSTVNTLIRISRYTLIVIDMDITDGLKPRVMRNRRHIILKLGDNDSGKSVEPLRSAVEQALAEPKRCPACAEHHG
jgi:hypothetical protein